MYKKLILFSLLFFSFFIAKTKAETDDLGRLEIILDIPDTLVEMGSSGYLNIYLSNFYYEVFGFQFVIESDNPDLIRFDFSNNGYDTTSTMTSGWEYVLAIDTLGDQSKLWFRCIADISLIPGDVDGISPQQGGVAVKIPYNTYYDYSPSPSQTVNLKFSTPVDFSDPFGYSIGVEVDTTYDSTYFNCLNRIDGDCVDWEEVTDTLLGYDTIFLIPVPYGYMDTNQVKLFDGSLTLEKVNCDLTATGELDISDLLCLVDYMFTEMDYELCPNLYCDTDNSGQLDISDLLYIVDFMFNEGPPPQ